MDVYLLNASLGEALTVLVELAAIVHEALRCARDVLQVLDCDLDLMGA